MSRKKTLIKDFVRLDENFDFNSISQFCDSNNCETSITSNYINNYINDSVFQIKHVHQTPDFQPMYQFLREKLNPNQRPDDLDLFYALVSGASSIVHKDPYQVHILNVKGHEVYRLNGAVYKMEPGDLLTIPENTTHQAIGLSPRIILSYAFY